ncbi:SLC13 family permease [uncultured Shewanella sp.]|uniref:SLC13 family permease n=1 Tax=uncultured Shewanella sp. TaxID=173975 RepID=UPI0026200610|nr:SLC13 family permease [uncultured Shewanella sp.]
MSLSLITTIIIFILISIRQWLPNWLRIWHIMSMGAIVILIMGEVSLKSAFLNIDWNVIAYLFGVFSIAAALYDSGISERMCDYLNKHHPSISISLLFLMVFSGITAAILTNDAAAVIGTPIALTLARLLKIRPTVLLIALCTAVTIGSMLTPVGNPQNILIAAKGHITNPMSSFALWLVVPTLFSMMFAFFWLLYVQKKWGGVCQEHVDLPKPNHGSSWPAYLSVALLITMILGDSVLISLNPNYHMPIGIMALIACLPVYLFNPHRHTVFKEVDWATLVFFVAMFIVTGAVLASGDLQTWLGPKITELDHPPLLTMISFWGSQLFSNVPLIEIYLQLLTQQSLSTMMLLSATSTLAGNLFIISAASNVIVVQQTEKFNAKPFSFWEFALTLLPITVVSLIFSYLWIVFVMS